MTSKESKLKRLEKANQFIKAIASCGRKFLQHDGFVANLELSSSGRVFFVDHYTKRKIYTHRDGRWKGFSSGGTMKMLIESLRDYVMKGETLRAGYFQPKMDNGFENPWGYGEDILKVKKVGLILGVVE